MNTTSKIKFHKGDATAPIGEGQKIICHVCNDVGAWGAGFVLAISKKWFEPERQYKTWHNYGSMAGFELGKSQLVRCTPDILVYNMIAQKGVISDDLIPPIRYDALRSCLSSLNEEAKRLNATVHMPRIGCGLAGGSWEEVEKIINETLDVEVNVYDL